MFKKLLSNLPYNPSLIGQVSFYAKRMHEEQRIRRLGLVFIALAFVVQLFAFVSQPEPTLANSSNDIIYGGFSTREQAVSICRNPDADFVRILAHFAVSCDALAGAETVTIQSDAYFGQLDSMGRNPQGPVITRTGKPTDEYAVDTFLAGRFYMRNLWAWDSGASSTYQMLKVINENGTPIFIMYKCGNIVTVGRYTPPPPPPPPPAVCPLDPSILASDSRCTACPYNTSILKSDRGCIQCPYPGLGNVGKDDPTCKEPCPYKSSITRDDPACKPCEASETEKDAEACLVLSKKARNNTQNIANADGTMAAGGDSITYTLSVKNGGKEKVNDFVITENIADISDYADITDLNGAKQEGVMIAWPPTDLSPGETVRKTLTVKVKNPIPRTPISASDPSRFDLVMNNVYGNAINIKLPPDVIKTTETITKTLPNTGPGETMLAIVGITVVVSYFFARSRLFAKELDIVRTDYTTTGGY